MTLILDPIPTDDALATQVQATAYGYGTIAEGYFRRASARVRGYTRQNITSATSTISLRSPFLLPERPVTSVSSITYTDADGSTATLTADTDYTIEGQYVIAPDYQYKYLTVTYTHGFETLPDELVEVVCAVAARMAATPSGLASGIASESADGEQITYGSDAFGGVTELTSAEKRVLDRIFPHTRSVPSVAVTL